MTKFTSIQLGLAVPAMLFSQAAWADLTTAQVWGDWKQYMEGVGYTITADEATNGDDLAVSNITMAMALPENAGALTVTLGSMNFVQSGADVDIVMPDVNPIGVSFSEGSAGEIFSMQFEHRQSGHSIKATGSPEQSNYDYSADTMSLTVAQFQVEGETFGPDKIKMTMTGEGMRSTTKMTLGDLRSYEQAGGVEKLAYEVDVNIPEESAVLKFTGNLDGLSFDATSAIPLDFQAASDMVAMLKAGFAMKGQFSFTSSGANVEFQDPNSGNFTGSSSSQGGNLNFHMNETEIAYGGGQNGLKVSAQAAVLPFPLEMSMAKSGFNLAMPISQTDDPQDFAFGITLGDFVMSDLLWSLFDPTSQLPRDPATIELDLAGKAKWLVDIMDPEALMFADNPGEIHSLTLSKLLVSAAGAKLEGAGDITFDNADMFTFPGMPKPVGAIDVALDGANGLMDKLVGMGLLPEQNAMGARMMMGMFAVPGDGPDALTSKIEFTQDGQVLANGQRIK